MKLARRLLLPAFCIAVAIACSSSRMSPLPDPVLSDGVETVVANFQFSRSSREARFSMVYAFDPPLVAGTTLRSEFENPLDPDSPLIVEAVLSEDSSSYEVTSPALPAIQDGGVYSAVLVGIDPNSNVVLFRHSQPVRFLRPPGI